MRFEDTVQNLVMHRVLDGGSKYTPCFDPIFIRSGHPRRECLLVEQYTFERVCTYISRLRLLLIEASNTDCLALSRENISLVVRVSQVAP